MNIQRSLLMILQDRFNILGLLIIIILVSQIFTNLQLRLLQQLKMYVTVDNRVVGSYCTSKLFQEMFHGRKTNIFKKSPRLFGFQRSQIESQLNGADGWELRTQWNILSKYQEIIIKYPTVFSTLSSQHHSAVIQFGFFGKGNISPI